MPRVSPDEPDYEQRRPGDAGQAQYPAGCAAETTQPAPVSRGGEHGAERGACPDDDRR
jgi:hypothetical protein